MHLNLDIKVLRKHKFARTLEHLILEKQLCESWINFCYKRTYDWKSNQDIKKINKSSCGWSTWSVRNGVGRLGVVIR